ncbi:MAG: hypothetical protein KAU03_06085 [Candidatus Altiarchaeales archaeon]|nr:hypothetical protein [Candidatus Altiarchaeales archaeon]
MKKYMKIGIVLLLIAIVGAIPVSADPVFMKGRGALYAESAGDGDLTPMHLGIGHGEVRVEVTDSTVLIHDFGIINTRVWAEGEGELTKDGRTWTYTGSGTVYAKGYGFYLVADGKVDKMLALGRGFASLHGTFNYFTLNWDKEEINPLLEAKIDQMETLVKDVGSGAVDSDSLDNRIAKIAA